ncbi:D-tyrosyl-tRNA(Tyr) deacylase [Candidatus Dojkabacteria bacterium]|uniref:D-aminoacyl-tRNA deacylase n=1 Tax=Candidatus Dojkabacteria bacterium TaxID=2099670 RepID=A0A955L3A9_9BACT|nr:D-tyrosyl-tRNA(Tyr) deacylase [Candidatus Dojkabacteria bacterium]
MLALTQNVKKADVKVRGKVISAIGEGLLIFLGVAKGDSEKDALWLVQKLANARIFMGEEEGKIDKSVKDLGYEVLIVSQFTLYADIKKGNRPSFTDAEVPDKAEKLYDYFVNEMNKELYGKIKSGEFGAYMEVSLVNDGPLTLIYESNGH